MLGINSVQLIGTVDREPAVLMGGKKVAFTVVCRSSYKTPDGTEKPVTNYLDCICFGKTAEEAQFKIHPGVHIAVIGELSSDSWDDKNTGEKKFKTVVKALNVRVESPLEDNRPQPERDVSRPF